MLMTNKLKIALAMSALALASCGGGGDDQRPQADIPGRSLSPSVLTIEGFKAYVLELKSIGRSEDLRDADLLPAGVAPETSETAQAEPIESFSMDPKQPIK